MEEEHGEGGEEMEEEEKMRVTRTSARLGRNQKLIEQEGVEKQPESDEIMVLDKDEEFSEEEESKYVQACKRRKCHVRILRIKDVSNEESESGYFKSKNTNDFVKCLLDNILKNVVDEHVDQYVKEILCHIINNVVPD